MFPDPYTREKLALEHRQQLLREAEYDRRASDLLQSSSFSFFLRRLAGRFGKGLIGLGTRLQQLEQSSRAVEYHAESR